MALPQKKMPTLPTIDTQTPVHTSSRKPYGDLDAPKFTSPPPTTPPLQQGAKWASSAADYSDYPDSPVSIDSPINSTSPLSPATPQTGRWASLDQQVSVVNADTPGSLLGRLSRSSSIRRVSSTHSRKVGELVLSRQIGSGAFSRTFQAHGPAGVFAVKERLPSTHPELFVHERRVLEKLGGDPHRGVVRFFPELCQDDYLVFKVYDSNLLAIVNSPKFALNPDSIDFWDFRNLTQPVVRLERWARWSRQLAEGMQFIHSRNIIHADFKPDNVLISGEDVVIADFSSAVDLDTESSTTLSRDLATGIAWDPAFTDPLLRSGREQPNFGSDIYALGLVLAFCATGKEPYSGSKNPTQRMMWMVKVGPLESFDPDVEQKLSIVRPVIARCLARDSIDTIISAIGTLPI